MSATASHDLLDADELMHLALRSIESEQLDDALVYLKRAIARAPDEGALYYLLGVLHANLGMTGRAAEEMAEALRLSPEAHAARFHLGWLQFGEGDADTARETWQELAVLGPGHALVLFRDGIEAMLREDHAACATLVRRALEAAEDGTFEDEMAAVLAYAEEQLGGAPQPQETTPKPPGGEAGRKPSGRGAEHALLAGYRKRLSPDDEPG